MFKKTKVRQILELLHKDLSAREISKTLNVSRNSVAFVKESYDKCDKDWDEICLMNDDEIYQLFYPHTFRPRNRFAPVDYSFEHTTERGPPCGTPVIVAFSRPFSITPAFRYFRIRFNVVLSFTCSLSI